MVRGLLAYLAAAATTVVLSAAFYTQQILAKQAEIGAVYTPAQQFETFLFNLKGLALGSFPSFGLVLAIALGAGFVIAAGLKRVLTPLAPIAYPLAGAAAAVALISLIENVAFGGGVGAIGGARGPVGLALQGLAGAIGGLVFALLLGGGRR